jgi:hypothetical protein
MNADVTCPTCGRTQRILVESVGKVIKCRFCAAKFATCADSGAPAQPPLAARRSTAGSIRRPSRQPTDEATLDLDSLRREARRLERARGRDQLLSFGFGLPALALQFVGACLLVFGKPGTDGILPLGAGTVLLCIGIGFAINYKRYNLAWILLTLLGVVGLFVLAVIPDEKRRRLRQIRNIMLKVEEDQLRRRHLPAALPLLLPEAEPILDVLPADAPGPLRAKPGPHIQPPPAT